MNGIIIFCGLVVLLWFGRSILIPLLVAIFLWYLINAIAAYFRKILPFSYCEKNARDFGPDFSILYQLYYLHPVCCFYFIHL